MRKFIFFFLLSGSFLSVEKISGQVPISSMFFSQNYWQPNLGAFTGQLQSFWSDIQASKVRFMRVGGNSYDGTGMWTQSQLLFIINEIRGKGIEPIIQVPIDVNKTIAQNASDCANWVNFINNVSNKSIIYWAIGNEPDLSYTGGNNYSTTSQIKQYIQQVSTAMKGVAGQSGIKIIGPTLSAYYYPLYANLLYNGTDDITGVGPNGYYIDYISFNTYPYNKTSLMAANA